MARFAGVGGRNEQSHDATEATTPLPDLILDVAGQQDPHVHTLEWQFDHSDSASFSDYLVAYRWKVPYGDGQAGPSGRWSDRQILSSDVRVRRLPLNRAVHSTDGVVTGRLASRDGRFVELFPGEQLNLYYERPEIEPGEERCFVFAAVGYHVAY